MRALIVSAVFSIVGVVTTVQHRILAIFYRDDGSRSISAPLAMRCARAKFYLRMPQHPASARSPIRLG